MIIVRRYADENRMKKLRPPLFVYGRRKTGKTFFVKNLFRDSYYFFVKRVGAFISKTEMMRPKIFKLVKEKYYI